MKLAATVAEVRREVAAARERGERIALVPTMGFLHEGHLSLVDHARSAADRVVMSIFVNPMQFGAGEDLERYPRDLQRDRALARGRGVDLLFTPSAEEVYPHGSTRVTVDPGSLGERLCGAYRPGHFRGVLTVVAKLFGIVDPDVAVFGRKDFQQSVLVRLMVRDLDMDVELETAPIVREGDGLALSSRNVYLSPGERADALGLIASLKAAQGLFASGVRDTEELLSAVVDVISARPLLDLQYAELVAAHDLSSVDRASVGDVVLVAANCGSTRLIDNWTLA